MALHRTEPAVNAGAALATGCALAFLSAAVNACFLVRLGTSVSHLTGDVSKVALDVARASDGSHLSVANLVAATFGFVGGAGAVGYWIHHPELGVLRPYGRCMITLALCLIAAHFALELHPVLSITLAAFACGLQNGMATHYKGIILRTTHLTGLLTDFGTHLGMRFRGHRIPRRKIMVPLALVLSFFLGAAAGASLILSGHPHPLLLLAAIYLAGGTGWALRNRAQSRALATRADP